MVAKVLPDREAMSRRDFERLWMQSLGLGRREFEDGYRVRPCACEDVGCYGWRIMRREEHAELVARCGADVEARLPHWAGAGLPPATAAARRAS